MNKRLLSLALALVLVVTAGAQGGPPQGGFGGPPGGPGMMMGGPGGRMDDLSLLSRNDVQTDLALTADQKTKLQALMKNRRGPGGQGRPGGQGGPGGPPQGGQGGFGGPPEGGQGGPPQGGFGGPGGDFDPEQMRAEMEKRQAEQKKQLEAILTAAQIKRLGEIRIQMQGNMAVMDPKVQEEIGLTDEQKDKIQVAMEEQRENMRPPDMVEGERPDPQKMQAQMKAMQDKMNAAIGAILTADQKAKLKDMGGKPFKRVDPQPGQGRPGGGGN